MHIYDYYETGDGTQVTHSDMQPDGSVRVFFANGDKHAEIRLPDGVIIDNAGFTPEEMSSFLISTARGKQSIMRYAQEGGIDHAWAV